MARLDLDTIDGNNAGASFQQRNFSSLIASHGLAGGPSPGSCVVYNVPGGHGVVVSDPFSVPGLDAGPQINVKGPGGTKNVPLIATGSYGVQLSAKGQPNYLVPGSYSIDNGSGGKDIGQFTASLTIPQPIVWTNLATTKTVSGSQDTLITWTGGGPNDAVSMIGITGIANIATDTEFLCTAPASAGRFTIPAMVFSLLPVNGIESTGTAGADLIVGLVSSVTFNAPNLDFGFLFSNTTSSTIVSIR